MRKSLQAPNKNIKTHLSLLLLSFRIGICLIDRVSRLVLLQMLLKEFEASLVQDCGHVVGTEDGGRCKGVMAVVMARRLLFCSSWCMAVVLLIAC